MHHVWYWCMRLSAWCARRCAWMAKHMGQTDEDQWMYRVCFWFSRWAMTFLDLWDGGYPPYQEED